MKSSLGRTVPGYVTSAGIATNTAAVTANGAATTLVPTNPEVFHYDADGNLTQDGLRHYTWDAENRLIAVEMLTNAVPADSWQKVSCAYDPQGRRIVQQVSRWNGTVSNRKFLYWGWNLVAEMDEVTGLRVSYTWGLPLRE